MGRSIGRSGKPTAMKVGRELVIDSSATLAWIYPDEVTDAIRDVFDRVTADAVLFRRYGA